MLKLTALTATGHNARGDNVIEYLTETQSLRDLAGYYVGAEGLEEDTMRWRGHGAAMLNLSGTPDKAQMIELAAGYSPDGLKTKLCQNAGKGPEKVLKIDPQTQQPRLLANGHPEFVWKGGHQVGYDCVFNAPKSVSLLLAMADPDERGKILAAHRRAVDQGLEYMESKVETRLGKGGKDVVGVDGLVITSCDHLANRNLEPHLHTHNLLFGVALRPDGKWGGWESSEMYRHQKAADTIYMAHLAQNLRDLGYGIEQTAELDPDQQDTGVRAWKVAGIDDATIAAFSTRKQEIVDAMTEGLTHQEAWAQTRAHKDEPSPEELFSTWERVIPAMGQSNDLAQLKALPDIQAPFRSDEQILEALHATTAIVAEKDILWEVSRARAGQGPDALKADVERLKESMVAIAPERQAAIDQGNHVSRRYSETRFAWSKIVDWEQEVQARADARKDDTAVRVPDRILDKVIKDYQQEKGFTLSDEQLEAVHHLCADSGGHAVMAGVAGAGKTTVADLYKRCFEANGQELIGACVSRKAAGKLKEESGMEAISVTKLLMKLDNGHKLTKDIPGLTAKSVVVLDEAGMVDTEAVRRLMRHVDDAGAKLILQGDMKQLQAIGAGAGMALVSERLGQTELSEIRRQKNADDRDIAIAFYDRDAQGRVILDNRAEPKSRAEVVAKGATLWKKLEARGAIDAYNTRGEAADALVRDWMDSPHAIDNRLVLVHTHEDSALLTGKFRDGLRDRSVLTGEDHTFQARRDKRLYDMTLAVGDRVRITKNDSQRGVDNGDMCVVESVSRTDTGSLALGLRVEGKAGQPSFLLAVDTGEWNHLQAGYCRTVHDAQGQGKPAVFHFANASMVDNQSALVAFTRLTSDRYRMYGADVELEQVKNRLGADRLKQNAIQEGFWAENAKPRRTTLEQDYDRVLQQQPTRGLER